MSPRECVRMYLSTAMCPWLAASIIGVRPYLSDEQLKKYSVAKYHAVGPIGGCLHLVEVSHRGGIALEARQMKRRPAIHVGYETVNLHPTGQLFAEDGSTNSYTFSILSKCLMAAWRTWSQAKCRAEYPAYTESRLVVALTSSWQETASLLISSFFFSFLSLTGRNLSSHAVFPVMAAAWNGSRP